MLTCTSYEQQPTREVLQVCLELVSMLEKKDAPEVTHLVTILDAVDVATVLLGGISYDRCLRLVL